MTTSAGKTKSRIRAARAELESARAGIERDIAPWRRSFDRRRTAWLVASGFAGGFALSFLPPRVWARIGALAGGSAAVIARSLVTPMVAGVLLARKEDRPATNAESEPGAAH